MSGLDDILGLIKLRIKKGVNLIQKDRGTSDSYVVANINEAKVKTRVVKDSCNPEWNDELTLFVKDVNIPLHLTVCDKDTFTSDDKMGEADIDLKPYLEFVKLGMNDLPDGHVLKSFQPDGSNCFAEESKLIWKDGKIIQEVCIRLKNVASGEVHLEIEWVDVPGSLGLSHVQF